MSIDEPLAHAPPRTLPGATILQIVPALTENHATRGAIDVAYALLRAGARAIIAGADGPLVSELQGFGGEWVSLPSETTHPLRLKGNADQLASLVAAERIDLIHTRGVGAARSAAAVAGRTGAWLVNSFCVPLSTSGRPDRPYARALLAGHRAVAYSAYVADAMVEQYGVPREKIAIIPRRIDTCAFDPQGVGPERVAALRQAWNLRRDERVILVPGRIDPAKGQFIMVEAMRLLVNGGLRGVVCVLAGEGKRHANYARAISRAAEANGIGPLIRYVGVCPDMPAAYAAADLAVVPAIEPPTFGRVAAEAMTMGRPVIASAIGALPELALAPPLVAETERTGWLATPNDALALARAIATAEALDIETFRAIGARARQLAARFDPARIAAATLSLYGSLLEAHP